MKKRGFLKLIGTVFLLVMCLISPIVGAVSEIKDLFQASTAMTITVASLATSTTGVGRQSTLIDNTTVRASEALIYCKITVGTTPTANKPIYVYLLRGDDPASSNYRTDGAGATDAGLTIINAQLLGTIMCTAATSDVAYRGDFSTRSLGPLGKEWGIGIVHETAVNLNATAGNHFVRYVTLNPEAQ